MDHRHAAGYNRCTNVEFCLPFRRPPKDRAEPSRAPSLLLNMMALDPVQSGFATGWPRGLSRSRMQPRPFSVFHNDPVRAAQAAQTPRSTSLPTSDRAAPTCRSRCNARASSAVFPSSRSPAKTCSTVWSAPGQERHNLYRQIRRVEHE